MDTVSLAGKGSKTYEAGCRKRVKKLIEFDPSNYPKPTKLPVITLVIVTNTADFDDVLTTKARC